MKNTRNIYNDFECYKYKDILNNVNIAICNTKSEIEYNIKEGHKTKCELVIKIVGELDARIYKYDNINNLLQAVYFIWQLDVYRKDIELLQVFINKEITYIFDYWRTENERKLQQEIEQLEKEIKYYKSFLAKYKSEKLFDEYLKGMEN